MKPSPLPTLPVTKCMLGLLLVLFSGARPSTVGATSFPQLVQNLSAWYDASNSGSITLASNPSVSAWNDLSGNIETLTQSTSGDQPTYLTSGINNMGSLSFNGSTDFLISSDTNFSRFLLPASTVFVVMNPANATSQMTPVASINTGVTEGVWLTTPWNGTANYNMYKNQVSATPSPLTGAHIWTMDGSEGSTMTFNRDGTTIASGSVGSGTGISCPLTVGVGIQCTNTGTAGNYYNGSIGEIVVYDAALSQTNYQIVEGYLACKWGLQSNLPTGHPYYSTCPSGTPTTFSPSISGLAAWYDASNSGSITTVTSPKVTTWNDLSGNGETLAQGTSANRPTYTTSCVNSKTCLTFDGTTSYLLSNDTNFSRLLFPASSVFIVENSANDTQQAATFFSGPSSQVWRYDLNIPFSCCGSLIFYDLGNTGGNSIFSSVSSVGTHVWAAVGSTTSGSMTLLKDGTTIASKTTASSVSTSACGLSVGVMAYCGTVNSAYFNGSIEEIVVYNQALSMAEYQYVEGYLACKWGTQSSLPSTHPYYSTCPTGTAGFSLNTVVSPTGAQVPGTSLTYTTTYTNNGGFLNYNPVVISPLPTNTAFFVGSASSNQQTTGLSVAVTYSNNNGTSYVYTPVSGGGVGPSGYDSTVTNVKWSFTGALGCGSVNNVGTTSFTARIN